MSFAGQAFTKETYFSFPKQVAVMRVFDEGDVDTFIGIGYKDVVICLCCGTIFGVEELEEDGAVYKVLDWHDVQVRELINPFDDDEDSES